MTQIIPTTGHRSQLHLSPPSVLAQAAQERWEGGDLRSVVQILATDPKDRLAAALARLGRAFIARDA